MEIYVGNISFKAKSNDLEDLFKSYGEVTSSSVISDKFSGRSKGFGFVSMPNAEEANSAIEALNEFEFMGRRIRVNESRPREERPRHKSHGHSHNRNEKSSDFKKKRDFWEQKSRNSY